MRSDRAMAGYVEGHCKNGPGGFPMMQMAMDIFEYLTSEETDEEEQHAQVVKSTYRRRPNSSNHLSCNTGNILHAVGDGEHVHLPGAEGADGLALRYMDGPRRERQGEDPFGVRQEDIACMSARSRGYNME